MMRERPGQLALRCVNAYRRRDLMAYLGLRYYFNCLATRGDQWATEVATGLMRTRTQAAYFRSFHFKEMDGERSVKHRVICLPTVNEILAEAVLLGECARRIEYRNPTCAFAYALNSDDSSGMFKHYIHGLRDRQRRIGAACDGCSDGFVQYADVKCFYPSIKREVAIRAWEAACDSAKLPHLLRELGLVLIDGHCRFGEAGNSSILTGPMFSHLIGNLVFRDVDVTMSQYVRARYFRYVDDITLVGDDNSITCALDVLRKKLDELGLTLHESEPKTYRVKANEWLIGRNDFAETKTKISWARLIGELKVFLLCNPGRCAMLQAAFRDESLRIPVWDYSTVARESACAERILCWGRRLTSRVTVKTLISLAKNLRDEVQNEFRSLAEGASSLEGYQRKRRVTALRYRAGKLAYLARDSDLSGLVGAISDLPELRAQKECLRAIHTRSIDDLLKLGSNAVQAVAQPLAASGATCSLTKKLRSENGEVVEQGLAYLLLNGVTVNRESDASVEGAILVKLASSGADRAMMQSSDPYLREVCCLHGLKEPRHAEIMKAPFDEHEDLVFDSVEQGYHTSS